ncbi:MAG: hypothetical protein M1831_002064 [Alyxoria varia]|nr:MAG: hypothetical protein M1831_002064 [Alyxoria varia]
MPSGIDVEALLDSTADDHAAKSKDAENPAEQAPRFGSDKGDRHERDRSRRDRSSDRGRKHKAGEGEEVTSPRSDKGSAHDSHKGRQRSRSRDPERHYSRRDRDRRRDLMDPEPGYRGSGGDFYRGGGRARSRSRSPDGDRYYRPTGRGRNDYDRYRERDRDRDRGGRGGRQRPRSRSPNKPANTAEPQLTEDERDKRTVFVQQLAARLRTKELIAFFEKVGPVKEAQIVKDRISGRSKGVGYVEFKQEESVPLAIQLTGQKLLGIPIIAQLTEAEKNRQSRTTEPANTGNNNNSVPFHRLYVGNIHFSINETDLQNVFEPFGELEFVNLQKEEQGRSRGYGFVQFRDPAQAKEALDKMNGFELAGRPIRVGLGNDKFSSDSNTTMLQRYQGPGQSGFQGSAFSGSGGRGAHAGGANGNFDRAGGRDNEKGASGASALDDTDVAGVNFSNYSRDALMRKLARTDEGSTETSGNKQHRAAKPAKPQTKQPPVVESMASQCVLLRNMFDATNESGDTWVKELEDDVREECEQKYGHVVHIALDRNSAGDIYMKFDRVQGGENAIQGLNGRWFGGNRISAQPVVDAVYKSLFSQA